MNKKLKQLLCDDIEVYEASLFTTPYLSSVYHAEKALLTLLEDKPLPFKKVEPCEKCLRGGNGAYCFHSET